MKQKKTWAFFKAERKNLGEMREKLVEKEWLELARSLRKRLKKFVYVFKEQMR